MEFTASPPHSLQCAFIANNSMWNQSRINPLPSRVETFNSKQQTTASPSPYIEDTRHLIAPRSNLARALMGNTTPTNQMEESLPSVDSRHCSSASSSTTQHKHTQQRQAQSNLSVLLSKHKENNTLNTCEVFDNIGHIQSPHSISGILPTTIRPLGKPDEADSASGPCLMSLGCHSAPKEMRPRLINPNTSVHLPSKKVSSPIVDQVRRCMSSKDLRNFVPPSGSPYLNMLNRKEEIEFKMRERLHERRESNHLLPTSETQPRKTFEMDNESASTSTRAAGANETRNIRRAKHHQAVVNDLCEIVRDLFIAESKLLNPSTYGVSHPLMTANNFQRDQVLSSVQKFVSTLPTRYALGVDTPSEVLLHMRLMAAVRSSRHRAVVHINNIEDDSQWREKNLEKGENRKKFVVTISCVDKDGLLEYITKLLRTGGSRVVDADVMLSSDRIALDRFVVEMNGRLRLDKLANLIEAFIQRKENNEQDLNPQGANENQSELSQSSTLSPDGQVYFNPPPPPKDPETLTSQEIESAVPLTEVLASPKSYGSLAGFRESFHDLQRRNTIPRDAYTQPPEVTHIPTLMPANEPIPLTNENDKLKNTRQRRQLINRRASPDLDKIGVQSPDDSMHYVTVHIPDVTISSGAEARIIPLIPFDDLMLIETLGTGRVSTIYRAAWQRGSLLGDAETAVSDVHMVALKVAMLNPNNGDTSHIDELRREADIAARLQHPNVSELVGVAADAECFCLAYDFCEGGSLLSLLSDSSRYYEYLPIALDIANGMAYLHSRSIIHRDLKPSNILLSRDHRAKIADFGMSVANWGQELTAETGTYRYMAPEVIRHESYSSNADVYSFGICLWQLITRKVPFASMTPIQAAYAVAEGRRPEIPPSTPRRLQEIIQACWDQDSHRRPSFTYIAMALADYVKKAFSPANVGALTLQIANEMLANVEGNATVNVDFTTPVTATDSPNYLRNGLYSCNTDSANVGLEIE